MIPIYVFGEDNGGIARYIFQALKNRNAALISKGEAEFPPADGKYVILETECLPRRAVGCGIIIICPETPPHRRISVPSGYTVVVGSDNTSALARLKNERRQIITCGMSVRDTLSVSSCAENTAAVSLQRQIVRLNGLTVGECEITVKSDGATKYAVLARTAVELLVSREE